MDQNTSALIERLKRDPALAQRVLSSGDGQALMNALTQDGGDTLREATADAAKGNVKALSSMLRNLMNSPDGAALIQRLGNSIQQQNH